MMPESKFFTAAPSSTARAVRLKLAKTVADELKCSQDEAGDAIADAAARIQKLPVADQRWIATLRALRDITSVTRGLGGGGTPLYHRCGRECDHAADQLADSLVKTSDERLRHVCRYLLLNPPSGEAEIHA